MTFSYNGTIPNPPDDPANDVAQMQTNASSIASLIAIDHIGFNIANGGYHNVIHFQNQTGGDPATIAGFGQEYTKTANSDQQLFYKSGGGVVTQLTGPNSPVAADYGYTWLPGGILLQWGYVFGTHGSSAHFNGGDTGTVTFSSANIKFPNNLFGVWANPFYNSNTTSVPSSQATIAVDYYTASATSFNWAFITSSSQYTAFFWVAIGN
jgi:hypothetical protein